MFGSALWFWTCADASAEREKPTVETKIGVADLDRILHSYWRTSEVRSQLERYKRSEAFRQKQIEVAELEREASNQRFWFLKRKRATQEIQQKRQELQELAEKEKERVREREEEAIEDLRADANGAAGAVGREFELTAIFDSNTPHILFVDSYGSGIADVTDAIINNLNTR